MEKRRTLLCGIAVSWALLALPIGRAGGAAGPKGERKPLALRVAEGTAFFEGILKDAGYQVGTTEQIQDAARNGSAASIRWSALYLLTHRLREGAVPILVDGLKDSDVYVRAHAAELLGALGRKDGIPVLRRDLAHLAPQNGAPDPNLQELKGGELRRATGARNTRLIRALEVARVLAELGDPSGLELSARLALESDQALFRKQAIQTLIRLAKYDRAILVNQSIDPTSVLVAIAESESQATVLRALMSGSAELELSGARPILQKLAASPHLSAEDREAARRRLEYREWKARRQSETPSAEPK